MKLLFDLFPVVLFFVAYKTYDIFVATGVAIIASLTQTLWHFYRHRSFEKVHVITFFMLLIFGGLTIFLRDPEFLMWKVSVVNVLFALVFIGSFFVGDKTLIERMLGSQITMPKTVWLKLNAIWSLLFIAIAFVNAYFVNVAITARNNFLTVFEQGKNESFNQLNCASNISPDLCLLAQQTEASWVNFKLFGTMGMTLVFVVLTGFYINQYVKESSN